MNECSRPIHSLLEYYIESPGMDRAKLGGVEGWFQLLTTSPNFTYFRFSAILTILDL